MIVVHCTAVGEDELWMIMKKYTSCNVIILVCIMIIYSTYYYVLEK